eukprot:4334243-Pyramimonas_sp.AAC.1
MATPISVDATMRVAMMVTMVAMTTARQTSAPPVTMTMSSRRRWRFLKEFDMRSRPVCAIGPR